MVSTDPSSRVHFESRVSGGPVKNAGRLADNLQITPGSVFQAWHLLINDALAIDDTKDMGFFLGAEDSWAGDWLHV
jgi:hypothetical protein